MQILLLDTILAGIPGIANVELSRPAPTVAFTPYTGVTSYIYTTFSNDAYDWNTLGSSYRIPIADSRVYFSENGDEEFTGFKIAVATNGTDIKSINANLDAEPVVIFSGAIVTSGSSPLHRLETSNGTSPYFFASTSGSPTAASQFFQRNPTFSTFTEYSTGLPSNNITIIRVDDRIS